MNPKRLYAIAGISYLIIFFTAIFANFFVLEKLLENPVETMRQNQVTVRLGILAFLLTVVFDVVVAWALYELFKKHPLSGLSTYFRMMHAAIMGVAIFALPLALNLTGESEILEKANTFNTLWLIGLFFFGIHLVLLGRIVKTPRVIGFFLMVAGVMYMLDTTAHFLLANYDSYKTLFLALVAIPSIVGEMSFTVWLLLKGGKN